MTKLKIWSFVLPFFIKTNKFNFLDQVQIFLQIVDLHLRWPSAITFGGEDDGEQIYDLILFGATNARANPWYQRYKV